MELTDEQKQRIHQATKWAWTDLAYRASELMLPSDPPAFIAEVVVDYLADA